VLWLYEIDEGKTLKIASSEYNNFSHLTWSPDGKFLYFLSDRYFNSVVRSPWGPYQPEPFFDRTTKIYVLPLQSSDKSPFLPDNEILTGNKSDKKSEKSDEEKDKEVVVKIDLIDMGKRISEIPVEAGMFYGLTANDKHLFFVDREMSLNGKRHLKVLEIKNTDIEIKTLLKEIDDYEISYDGKKIMVQKKQQIYIVDAGTSAPTELDKSKVDLSQWTFTVDPQEEWRQMFVEAWRLERDYFYDPQMHGVDYQGLLNRYLPYVSRVISDRTYLPG